MLTRWRVVLVAVLLVLGLYALLPALSGLPGVREWVAARLERATGWRVRFESLRLNHDLSLTFGSLAVAQPERPPFLTVDHLDVGLRPLSLLSGRPWRVRAEAPHLHMQELPAMPSTGSGGGAGALAHAEIVDGFVHLPAGGQSAAIGPLTLAIDAAAGTAEQLTLTGQGRLAGGSGSLAWSAELGSTLEQSHGTLNLDAAPPLDALRPWVDVAVPADLAPTAAALRLAWHGAAAGRIAIDVASDWHLPLSDKALHVTGDGEIDPAKRDAQLTLASKDVALRSADATRAASGIELRAELAARPSETGMQIDFALNVPRGEVLWDRFYADLRGAPVALRGSVTSAAQQLTLSRATLSVRGVGTAAVSGSYDRERQQDRWRAELDLPGLENAYRLAVRDPLQADYPGLARLDVRGRAGGVIEQDRSPSGERRFTGFLELSGVSLSAPDLRLAVAALDAHVPFNLGDEDSRAAAAESGNLRLGEVVIGDVPIGDVDMRLRAEANQLSIVEPVRIAVLGGALEIADLRATQLTAEPRVSLALALHDLRLDELSRALGWPPLSGVMGGTIPAVLVDRHTLESQGEIRIDAFGGTARVGQLRVEELLSRVPTVRLDVEIEDLSLTELTGTFEVGRISGVVNAAIRDLQIADGQPVHFDAWLETVPKPGVPQRISVTAIRQISILGGSGGDPISLGVLGFFDEYRYAKMGFRCRLENDRFELHGVEEDDGADYLVVGATLPPRVNVISHTREISFSELMRRLGRVFALRESPLRSSDAETAPADAAPQ